MSTLPINTVAGHTMNAPGEARLQPDGLKVTLSSVGFGLTVNKQGHPLLPKPFVFQSGPLEEFQIAHTQSFGTYDTIDDDQFIRRGSRQLDTWQFDTLAMYLGIDSSGNHKPHWVPYPTKQPKHFRAGYQQFQPPEWYVSQLKALHAAGSPFWFTAAFKDSTTIRHSYAVLTGFTEDYKHGEGDAIYLSSVSFSEWRDPGNITTKKRGHTKLPTQVKFRIVKGDYIAYEAKTGRAIPTRGKNGTTLNDLSRWFYGDPKHWKLIAHTNKMHGGSGSTPIYKHWWPHQLSKGKPTHTMHIPKKPQKPNPPRTPPAHGHTHHH